MRLDIIHTPRDKLSHKIDVIIVATDSFDYLAVILNLKLDFQLIPGRE